MIDVVSVVTHKTPRFHYTNTTGLKNYKLNTFEWEKWKHPYQIMTMDKTFKLGNVVSDLCRLWSK